MSLHHKSVQVISVMNAVAVSPAQVEIRDLSAGERAINGAKVLALWWLAAIVCILVPVFHFVLVPGAAILGLAFGGRQMLLKEKWVQGELTCPECQAKIVPDQKPFNSPKHIKCPACRKDLILKPA